MATDTELRLQIGKKLKWWRKHDLSDLYYPLDDIMHLIAAHDQQMKEKLLAQAVPSDTTPAGEPEYVPVTAIEQLYGDKNQDAAPTKLPTKPERE